MKIAKWVFTVVQAIAVIITLAVSIVVANDAATDICDQRTETSSTCVSDIVNATMLAVGATIAFQVCTV